MTPEDRERLLELALQEGAGLVAALKLAAMAESWVQGGTLPDTLRPTRPVLVLPNTAEEGDSVDPAADESPSPPEKPTVAKKYKTKTFVSADQVIAALRKLGPNVSDSDLARHLGCSNSTVFNRLRDLETGGQIRRIGRRPGELRKIEIVGDSPPPSKPKRNSPSKTPPRRRRDLTGPEAKTRRCLMCDRDFESEGAGHRVCDRCKGTEAWKSSGLNPAVIDAGH